MDNRCIHGVWKSDSCFECEPQTASDAEECFPNEQFWKWAHSRFENIDKENDAYYGARWAWTAAMKWRDK